MSGFSFFQRASRLYRDNARLSKLFIVASVSGVGILSFTDTSPFQSGCNLAYPDDKKKQVVVLGTGWAATSFLKSLKDPTYEVQVISPPNYFAFTPLKPSLTNGTVEARSNEEPIRNIFEK